MLICVAIMQQSAILNMLKRCESKLKNIILYRKDVFLMAEPKKRRISVTVDDDAYNKAAQVFERLGMSSSTGISIYLNKVAEISGIPFDLTVHARRKGGE